MTIRVHCPDCKGTYTQLGPKSCPTQCGACGSQAINVTIPLIMFTPGERLELQKLIAKASGQFHDA